MKKITAIILATMMVVAFASCKKSDGGTESGQADSSVSQSSSSAAENGTDSTAESSKNDDFVSPAFTIGSEAKTAKVGDSITVPLSVSAGSTIAAIGLSISYDTDKLEYNGFEANSDAFMSADNEPETGTILISMISSSGQSISDAISLGNLTFKAKDGASGESKINISCTSCCDQDSNELHPTFDDPVITIG